MRIGVFWDLDNIKDDKSLDFIEKLLDSWRQSHSLSFTAAYGDRKYLANGIIDRLVKLGVDFFNTQFGKKNVTDQVLITEVFSKLIELRLELIVILSEDGDFQYLIQPIEKLGCQILLISQFEGEIPTVKLLNLRSEFDFLINSDKEKIKFNAIPEFLSLFEATLCLKMTLFQLLKIHDKITLSQLDVAMRKMQLFRYSGVKSINLESGKSFKRFSDFISFLELKNEIVINLEGPEKTITLHEIIELEPIEFDQAVAVLLDSAASLIGKDLQLNFSNIMIEMRNVSKGHFHRANQIIKGDLVYRKFSHFIQDAALLGHVSIVDNNQIFLPK